MSKQSAEEEKLINFIACVISIIITSLIVAGYVYLLIKYGNKPIDEIPTWVLWLLFRRD